MLEFLLYLVAFVCFMLVALGHGEVRRFILIGVGLAAWVFPSLVDTWPGG